MEAIRAAGLTLGVDPLGGASLPYWQPINAFYGLNIAVVNPRLDPPFAFMTVDHDGKIRMDCSSPYAMARLVALKDKYQRRVCERPGRRSSRDRHASVGLMNPNHYLAVAIRYLVTHRPRWKTTSAVGKTVVSSGLIDLVVHCAGTPAFEVPVGFKWFTQGFFEGKCCFGGEESAGASFLRRTARSGRPTRTDLIMDLLAAEITASTGKDPGEHYQGADRRVRDAVLYAHRRARRRQTRKRAC